MCGLVGVAGNLIKKEEDVFRYMLILDTIRGEDSTGIATVSPAKDILIAKGPGDPFLLFDTHAYRQAFQRKNVVLMGHNRSATIGKVNRLNAHPFEFDGLVGAHNGTLTNKYKLENGNNFDTDSAALFWNIRKYGPQKVISQTEGAWALTWYNSDDHTLHFLRNEERPLYFVFTENMQQLFWASEQWMLDIATNRAGIKTKDIQRLNPNMHLWFKVPHMNEQFGEGMVEELKGLPPFRGGKGNKVSGCQTIHFPNVNGETKPNKLKRLKDPGQYINKCYNGTLRDPLEKHCGLHYLYLDSTELPPDMDIRVYFSSENIFERWKDTRVNAKIKSFKEYGNGPVFKCSVSDLIELNKRLAPELHPIKHEKKKFTEQEFETMDTECCWCGSPVFYKEAWATVNDIQIVCECCKTDPTLQELGVKE